MSIENFKKIYGLRNEDLFLFPYGSRVYGTQSDNSDYDYIAIVKDGLVDTGIEYNYDNVNIHIYESSHWQYQLNDHKIHTLEAYFLPEGICAKNFKFKLDLVKLRNELSQKSNNSFVKAKKKIEVEKDYYIGWKSLFHSLRILNYGIQIASFGKIKDYAEVNHYWKEILEAQQYNWSYFKEKYQTEHNKLSSEFRKLAPKE